MHAKRGLPGAWFVLAMATTLLLVTSPALAASAASIDRDVTAALKKLYAGTPGAKTLVGHAFIFDQKGLMAGIGLQGSKISKITPDK